MTLVYVAIGCAVIMALALYIVIYIGGRSEDKMNELFLNAKYMCLECGEIFTGKELGAKGGYCPKCGSTLIEICK